MWNLIFATVAIFWLTPDPGRLVTSIPASPGAPSDLSPVPSPLGDTPPKGPPWKLTYREARRHALRAGTPVFVYFTKTY